MRRYTLYNQLMAVAAGLCLCWLFAACGEDRGRSPRHAPEQLCRDHHPADFPLGTTAANESRRDNYLGR